MVNSLSPYNIMIVRPVFNALKVTLSTLYLNMKYPLSNWRFGVVKGDQEMAIMCYIDSLNLRKRDKE